LTVRISVWGNVGWVARALAVEAAAGWDALGALAARGFEQAGGLGVSRHSGWACDVTEVGHGLGLRKPRPGSGGACWCSGCRAGAQSVAVVSAMAVRADDSSMMDLLVVKLARSAAMARLLIALGMPRA